MREKEAHLRLHIRPFFGRLRLADMKRELMKRFLARMTRDKKLSAKRAKNVTARCARCSFRRGGSLPTRAFRK